VLYTPPEISDKKIPERSNIAKVALGTPLRSNHFEFPPIQNPNSNSKDDKFQQQLISELFESTTPIENTNTSSSNIKSKEININELEKTASEYSNNEPPFSPEDTLKNKPVTISLLYQEQIIISEDGGSSFESTNKKKKNHPKKVRVSKIMEF